MVKKKKKLRQKRVKNTPKFSDMLVGLQKEEDVSMDSNETVA